ncbi:MAG: hypothetical protein OEY00_13580 [Gammaproteobacteria bacterium]|nr:hypothetical protein [Gammaproteobacteria bacterium]
MNVRHVMIILWVLSFSTACTSISSQEAEMSKLRPINSKSDIVKELYEIKNDIEQTHQVKVHFNKFCRTYWGRYKLTANNNELLAYMKMMQAEMKKYPPGYFVKSRASNMCLGENLSVNRITVAAMPAPENNILLYSVAREVSGKRKPYKLGYLTNTFHHELFHNTDYAIWGMHYYKWNKWHTLNTPGFKYAGKGTMAYTNKAAMREMKLLKGFMNKYSQTGMEEDRAEIMEAIMLYPQRELILRKCQRDEIIVKKVNLTADIVNTRILNDGSWPHLDKVVSLCNQPGKMTLRP